MKLSEIRPLSKHGTPDEHDAEPARVDDADQAALVDVIRELVEGATAQIVRTILRPLLPGGYDVIRYTSAVQSGQANSSGAVTLTFPDPGPGHVWLVDRIGLLASEGSWAQVAFYVGDPSMRRLVDISTLGSPDIADQAQPIVCGAGMPLTAVAAGMTSGAELHAHAAYRLAVAL